MTSGSSGSPYWLAVLTLIGLQGVTALSHITLPILAASAAADYGLSPGLVGIYGGLTFLGSAIATLVTGGMTPRVGSIRMCQAALLLNVAGLACLLPVEPMLLPLSALLVGLGYGPMTPASAFLLSRLVPAERLSLVFSIKQTCVPIGYAAAGLVLPWVTEAEGWQAAVGVALAIVCGAILAAEAVRRRLDRERGPGSPFVLRRIFAPLGMVWQYAGLRRMAVCSLAFSAVQLGMGTFLVVYLNTVVGLGLVEAGGVMAMANLAAFFARVGWGWLADRLQARWVLAGLGLGMAGSVAGVMAVTVAWPAWAVAGLGLMIGATVWGWNGVFLAETARNAPPGRVSEATSAVMVLTFMGSVAGPPLLTLLLALTGSYAVGFVLSGLLAVAIAGLFVLFPVRGEEGETA